MGFFSKGQAFLIKYKKNGIDNRIIIKAKTKNDALEKFNRKVGYVESYDIVKKDDE